MKVKFIRLKSITTIAFVFLANAFSFSQTIHDRLSFEQGQNLSIRLQVKSFITQHAGGQVIDFTIDAQGLHSYKVTNTTADNTTLHHQLDQVSFAFDGWGQKMDFDSKKETDLNGMFGKPVKEALEKSYDIVIDTSGTVLMAVPEKIQPAEAGGRMAIVNNLLKDVFDLVHPPEKGKASFFKVLPGNPVTKGDTWTSSYENATGKFDAAYALTGITDSTLVINFAATSVTTVKAEIMGGETTTTMNNKSTGTIILDRKTGILKERTETVESNGTTVSSFGTLPVSSKTSIVITVNAAK